MKIFIHQHLGLGDMILCNGLIRHLLSLTSKNDRIFLFCKNIHYQSIKFMYRDEKKINLVSINNNKNEINEVNKILNKEKKSYELIKIGHEFYLPTSNLNLDKKNMWPCDIIFYKQLNVPFRYRFNKCYWKRDLKREKQVFKELVGDNKSYVFLHDDPMRNLIIDQKEVNHKYKIIRNDYKYSIFDYGLILENAKELHLMESSFRQLVETLNTNKPKLYLYKGRGADHSINLYNKNINKWIGTSKEWIVINDNIVKKNNNSLTFFKNFFKS